MRILPALLTLGLASAAQAFPLAATYYTNPKGVMLYIEDRDAEGFDFSLLSDVTCQEQEVRCLFISGRAVATAKGYTWSEGNSRIFFADTEEGVKILQTAGDLGADEDNRAEKLKLPGAFSVMDTGGDGDAVADPALHFFRSPTGNIGCMAVVTDQAELRCDLVDLVPSFTETPADCDFDYGHAFGIGSFDLSGEALCYSDTVVDPTAQVLDYDQKITFGEVTCWSQKTGMICENTQGHGFRISRRKQEIY